MSHLLKLPHEGYDEYWLDLDLVVSVGIGAATIQNDHGLAQVKGCIIVTAAGEKKVFGLDMYQKILEAKLKTEDGPPKDLDIPDSFLDAWKDPKGDDEDLTTT